MDSSSSSSSSTYLNPDHLKQDEDFDEENEDTLSLSDFPLSSNESEKHTQLYRRSSSEPSEFFEFLSSHETHIMSHAEDIILCGKLMPFQNVPQDSKFDERVLKSLSQEECSPRYCESLPDMNNRRSSNSRTHSTRSLDSDTVKRRRRNVRVVKRDVSEFQKKFEVKAAAATKPSWYVLVFGQVKFPAEMELKDIKSRQVRRSVGGDGSPARRCAGRGQDWLRVLSCKSDSALGVVPPTSIRGTVS